MSRLPELIETYLTISGKTDPIAWIQKHVNLTHDKTGASDGYIRLEPYQIMPILAQYQPECREVTIIAVEQTGKSTVWRMPLLHKAVEYPGPAWVVYESDDKAAEINEEQFDPLLRNLPQMRGAVNRRTALKHRYNLPNGATIDFSGAGSDITSKPKRDGVADELDTWPMPDDAIRQNLRNFKKRFRTYWARGEGCLVKVSSPSPRKKGESQDLTKSVIGDEFRDSDHGFAGYWTLRCMKCRKLTMPSHAVHNLQWECEDVGSDDDKTERVKPETLTMECPGCGHRHTFGQARKMNDEGGYCDADGNEITGYSRRVGYQWGALACPRVFHWLAVAEAQMAAGSTADMYAQADFDNSWRGLWFRPRRKHAPSLAAIRRHCAGMPDTSKIANAFFSADTQDNGWFWVVRAVGENNNLYHLGNGFCRTIQEVKERWDAAYSGVRCVMGIIDEGGHGDMPKYVRQLVAAERGLYSYKGGAFGERWGHSKNVPKLILGNAKQYQADLLYYMYSQDDRSNSYWFIPPEETLDEEYMAHLASMQRVNKKKHGDQYENYENLGQPDHYFDCEKQALCIIDVAYKELKTWRIPVANLRRGIAKPQPRRQAPSLEM